MKLQLTPSSYSSQFSLATSPTIKTFTESIKVLCFVFFYLSSFGLIRAGILQKPLKKYDI